MKCQKYVIKKFRNIDSIHNFKRWRSVSHIGENKVLYDGTYDNALFDKITGDSD